MSGTAASKLDDAQIKENDNFINSQAASQQMLLKQQDESLDQLSGAVTRLGQVGLTISEELQTQVSITLKPLLSKNLTLTLNRLNC